MAKEETNPTMTLRKFDGTCTEEEEKRATLFLEVLLPDCDLTLTDVEAVATTNYIKNSRRKGWDIAEEILNKPTA